MGGRNEPPLGDDIGDVRRGREMPMNWWEIHGGMMGWSPFFGRGVGSLPKTRLPRAGG